MDVYNGSAHVLRVSARSVQGKIQGGAKIGQGVPLSRAGQIYVTGVHLLKKTPFLDRKATATNRIHVNDLEARGKKFGYFWIHSEVYFLTRFGVILDLVIFQIIRFRLLFNATHFLSNSLISNGENCIHVIFVSPAKHSDT